MADSPADAEVTATLQTFGDKQIRNSHQLPDTSNAPTDEFREVPIVEQEAMIVRSNMSDFEKTQCLMTLALQDNNPWKVFTIAAAHGLRKGTSETTDILTKCASQLIDIDEMLMKNGIVPPPPSFIPAFPDELTPFRYARREISNSENSHKSHYFRHPPETIHKLKECFESFNGKVTAAQAEEVAIICNTTARRVKVFFKRHRANIRRAMIQQEKTLKTSSQNDEMKVFTLPN